MFSLKPKSMFKKAHLKGGMTTPQKQWDSEFALNSHGEAWVTWNICQGPEAIKRKQGYEKIQ